MDEPFGAIDPINRERLQNEFLRLQAEIRKTIVFVTHDIDEAIKMGDRIAMLKEGGHLAQYAPPAELLMAPADEFVEQFVGADRALKRLALQRVRDVDLIKVAQIRAGEPVPRRAPSATTPTSTWRCWSTTTAGRWAGCPSARSRASGCARSCARRRTDHRPGRRPARRARPTCSRPRRATLRSSTRAAHGRRPVDGRDQPRAAGPRRGDPHEHRAGRRRMIDVLAQVQIRERTGEGCVAENGFCPDWIADNLHKYWTRCSSTSG